MANNYPYDSKGETPWYPPSDPTPPPARARPYWPYPFLRSYPPTCESEILLALPPSQVLTPSLRERESPSTPNRLTMVVQPGWGEFVTYVAFRP